MNYNFHLKRYRFDSEISIWNFMKNKIDEIREDYKKNNNINDSLIINNISDIKNYIDNNKN